MLVSSKHGFSNCKDPKGNDVTDVSGTAVDNNNHYPLTQNPVLRL
jgi:hypothetical protein